MATQAYGSSFTLSLCSNCGQGESCAYICGYCRVSVCTSCTGQHYQSHVVTSVQNQEHASHHLHQSPNPSRLPPSVDEESAPKLPPRPRPAEHEQTPPLPPRPRPDSLGTVYFPPPRGTFSPPSVTKQAPYVPTSPLSRHSAPPDQQVRALQAPLDVKQTQAQINQIGNGKKHSSMFKSAFKNKHTRRAIKIAAVATAVVVGFDVVDMFTGGEDASFDTGIAEDASGPETVEPDDASDPETAEPDAAPYPEIIAPDAAPYSEIVAPDAAPYPETVAPDAAPYPETVAPDAASAPQTGLENVADTQQAAQIPAVNWASLQAAASMPAI